MPLAEHAGGPVRHVDAARLARREIAVIAGFILVLFIGGFTAWQLMIGQKTPDAVVKRFIDADVRGDVATLSKYVAPGMDSSVVLQLFQQYRRSTGTSPFINCKVHDSVKDGSRATVDVELKPTTANSSGPIVFTFALAYVDGNWRILSGETVASAITALVITGSQQFAGSLSGAIPQSFLQGLSGMLGQGLPGGTPPAFGGPQPSVPAPPLAPQPSTTTPPQKPGGTI